MFPWTEMHVKNMLHDAKKLVCALINSTIGSCLACDSKNKQNKLQMALIITARE